MSLLFIFKCCFTYIIQSGIGLRSCHNNTICFDLISYCLKVFIFSCEITLCLKFSMKLIMKLIKMVSKRDVTLFNFISQIYTVSYFSTFWFHGLQDKIRFRRTHGDPFLCSHFTRARVQLINVYSSSRVELSSYSSYDISWAI